MQYVCVLFGMVLGVALLEEVGLFFGVIFAQTVHEHGLADFEGVAGGSGVEVEIFGKR